MQYQLSLLNPRDEVVLQTELDDHCDKLAVDRRSYCQLLADRQQSSLSH